MVDASDGGSQWRNSEVLDLKIWEDTSVQDKLKCSNLNQAWLQIFPKKWRNGVNVLHMTSSYCSSAHAGHFKDICPILPIVSYIVNVKRHKKTSELSVKTCSFNLAILYNHEITMVKSI